MKKMKAYCIQCLRKYRHRDLTSDCCPFCNIAVRYNTSKIVAQIVTRLLRYRGLKPKDKKTDYSLYLSSNLWKVIRTRILWRDNWACLACGKPANVVHHKSYDRVVLDGKRDTDLVSLCYNCHSDIEFSYSSNNKKIKNSLRQANNRLAKLIKSKKNRFVSVESRFDVK